MTNEILEYYLQFHLYIYKQIKSNMKTVGIIGSGMVGQTLAKGFHKYGYHPIITTRNDQKAKELSEKLNGIAEVMSPAKAASKGDLLVLAVKGNQALDALKQIDEKFLNGKTIIDATNPIGNAPPENGVLNFSTSINHSLMEDLQAAVPKAHFVKAFNSVGSALMVDPEFETKPTMFICGDHDPAKEEVSQILELFGWEAEDMGKKEAARAIEPLCMLWCIPGFLHNQWNHAFKFLKPKL